MKNSYNYSNEYFNFGSYECEGSNWSRQFSCSTP